MELKAIQRTIAIDYKSGHKLLTYEVLSDETTESLEALQDKELRLTAKRWREKRSIDANSYYWQLISQLARKLKISTARCHNIMLRRSGVPELIDGLTVYILLPDTDKAEEQALESAAYHLSPTSKTDWNKDGRVRSYMLLKPSHEMDSEEFSGLVSNLAEECKEQGIETMTPDEIAHMIAAMGGGNEKHNAE